MFRLFTERTLVSLFAFFVRAFEDVINNKRSVDEVKTSKIPSKYQNIIAHNLDALNHH
jgi:hypothetical protein